jgi:hypothetical protein
VRTNIVLPIALAAALSLAASAARAQPGGVTPPIVVTHVDAVYPSSASRRSK